MHAQALVGKPALFLLSRKGEASSAVPDQSCNYVTWVHSKPLLLVKILSVLQVLRRGKQREKCILSKTSQNGA